MASKGDINSNDVQPILYSNWIKISFEGSLGKIGAFTKLKSKDYFELGTIPVVDQGEKLIAGYVNDEKLSYKGSAPVIIFGDHTRNLKYIDFKFAIGADGTKIIKPLEIFNSKFYFFYLKSLKIPDFGYSRHYKVLKSIHIPLPPLKEQQRIAAKLDNLFAELDTIKERLANIPMLLKNFRQSVLNQAVTGKLTEEWRKGKELEDVHLYYEQIDKDLDENYALLCHLAKEKGERKPRDQRKNKKSSKSDNNLPIIPDSWKYKRAEDLSYLITDGVHFKPKYIEAGVEFLSVKNVRPFTISNNGCKYISIEDHKEYVKRCKPEKDDILYTKVGATFGYAAKVKLDYEFSIYVSLALIKPSKLVNSDYLELLFNSELVFNQARNRVSGSGVPDLHLIEIRDFKLPIPLYEEQLEIVKTTSLLLTKIRLIEERYNYLEKKIETLPQAILAKAFKGELVPQLPTDGDAKELLAEIKKLKEATAPKKKKRTVKK